MEITRWAKTIKDALNRFAKKIPSDIRDDFEQDCWVRLCEGEQKINEIEANQGPVEVQKYVYAIVSNRIKDLVRIDKKRAGIFDMSLSEVRGEDEETDDEGILVEDDPKPAYGISDRELDAAIKQLTREEQHIIRSQYFQGHTWKEMISNLDRSRGSVWSVRDSALQKLREILEAK